MDYSANSIYLSSLVAAVAGSLNVLSLFLLVYCLMDDTIISIGFKFGPDVI